MIKQFHPLIYAAGAYKGDTVANTVKAEEVSIALIRNKWNVFTPHKNTFGYEKYEDHELSESTWISMNLGMLERCDALYVMDNWRESQGTQTEILFADEHGIPTFWEERIPANELNVEVLM